MTPTIDTALEVGEFVAGIAVLAAWMFGYIHATDPVGAIVLLAALFTVFGDAALEAVENYFGDIKTV